MIVCIVFGTYSSNDDAYRSRQRKPVTTTHCRSIQTGSGKQERLEETRSADELAASAQCEQHIHAFIPNCRVALAVALRSDWSRSGAVLEAPPV